MRAKYIKENLNKLYEAECSRQQVLVSVKPLLAITSVPSLKYFTTLNAPSYYHTR
jgi:hypothetical protein